MKICIFEIGSLLFSVVCKFVSCFAFELNVMSWVLCFLTDFFLFSFQEQSLLSNNEDVFTNNEFAGCYFSFVVLSNIMFIPRKRSNIMFCYMVHGN